jgi:hypothetical protein
MSCCIRLKKREIPNPLHILEGYLRKGLKGTKLANHEIEHMAKLRLQFCHNCKKEDGSNCLSDKNRCCECGCDMEAKVRVMGSSCPLNKW